MLIISVIVWVLAVWILCRFAICQFAIAGSPYASSPYVPVRHMHQFAMRLTKPDLMSGHANLTLWG